MKKMECYLLRRIGEVNMKIKKDEVLDVAYIELRSGKVAKTMEIQRGILLDLDAKGNVFGIEILSLSKMAPKLKKKKAA